MKKVVHFEIPVDDMDRAKKFYSIFGWQLSDWPMPDGTVYVGAINGGIIMRNAYSKTPSVTINVPSIDEYMEKVKAAGGKLLKEKQVLGESGAYAYTLDSEGNVLGLWEDAKK
jgi:hypothetical protein